MMDLSKAPLLTTALQLRLDVSLQSPPTVVAIPACLLNPGSEFEIRLSKVNPWPVNIYARIYPEMSVAASEAARHIESLMAHEPFFSRTASAASATDSLRSMRRDSPLSAPVPLSSTLQSSEEELMEESDDGRNPLSRQTTTVTAPSNNLFVKGSMSVGRDVEKLYFRVREKVHPVADAPYWLVLSVKPDGVVMASRHADAQRIYADFPINLSMDTMLFGVPTTVLPLISLILGVVIAYFGIIRRYQLRLFGLK